MNTVRQSKFVYATLILAITYFVLETLWHFKYGQFLPFLIVDYIAISLLIYGSYKVIKFNFGIGLLCGGWGFTACMNYVALFERVNSLLQGVGIGNPAIDTTAYVLAGLMLVSFGMFFVTIYFLHLESNGV